MKSGPEKRPVDPAYAAVFVDRPGTFDGGMLDIADKLGRPAGGMREAVVGGRPVCFTDCPALSVLWKPCKLEGKLSLGLACTGLSILPSTIVAPEAEVWAFRAFSV